MQMSEKTLLLYGSYKMEEIDIIRELFEKNHVEYELSIHKTGRGLEFHHLQGHVTRREQEAIRSELAQIIKRKWNWGRMTYMPMAD